MKRKENGLELNNLNSRFFQCIKKLFINDPYLELYPLSEKSDEEKQAFIDAVNKYENLDEESETASLIDTLYQYAMSRVGVEKLNGEIVERNINHSYKKKRKKVKDKETGIKVVKEVTYEKRGVKDLLNKYKKLQEENEIQLNKYAELVQALEKGELTVEQLPLCDEIIRENKYKKWIYIVLLAAVIGLPIMVFILSKIF